jgi:CIC family chloride channel protein
MTRRVRRVDRFVARRAELRTLARRSHEVLLLAGIVGLATGLGVALFDSAVTWGLDTLESAPLWFVAIAPAIGLGAAALVLRVLGGNASPSTADEYLRAFHAPSHRLTARHLVARMVAGVATLGTGAPMGLEGPSLYLGASLGNILPRRLPRIFAVRNRRMLLVAGAAAGVAAIFKAPATGAVFALEVPYQDDLARRMLGPALVASASGYLAFAAIHGTAALLPVSGSPPFTFRDLAGAVALGALAGLGARVFAWMLRRAKALTDLAHVWLRVPIAGAVLALLFVLARGLTGESLTTGPGYGTIEWALDPSHSIWLIGAVLVLRCIGTAVSVAGDGVGGLFIPLVVAGALAGRMVGGAVHALDTSLFTVIGVAAFLGAGYRVPLAGVTFVAEATGRPGFVVPGLIAAVVAELMMGTSSVTTYQVATTDPSAPVVPATDAVSESDRRSERP